MKQIGKDVCETTSMIMIELKCQLHEPLLFSGLGPEGQRLLTQKDGGNTSFWPLVRPHNQKLLK